MIQRILTLCMLASLAACSSTHLLADPQRGFAEDGPRQVSLAFDRMSIEAPDPDPAEPWTVELPLRLYNGTDQVWVVYAEDFDLQEAATGAEVPHPERTRAPDTRTEGTRTGAARGVGPPLTEIPPGTSGMHCLRVPLPLDPDQRQTFDGRRFRFRYYLPQPDGTARLILERDLVLDEFTPLRQGVYAGVLGALTLGVFLAL